MMSATRLVTAGIAALSLMACASGGSAPAGDRDPAFDLATVRSVYVETPVQVTTRGSDGVGNVQIAEAAERQLRAYLRAQRGWTIAGAPIDADVRVRLQITEWESGSTGSRVGATVELIRSTDQARVLRAGATYPSRFGTPAPGAPIDLMEPLLDELLGDDS